MPAKPRRRIFGLWVMLTVLAVAFTGSPAAAQRLRIIPVPPNVKAQWTPLPDLPQVSYAPNIPTDVFRHKGRYYFYWEGAWYQSKNIKGPWNHQANPPAILSGIQPGYYKTLPRAPAPSPGAGVPGAPPAEGFVTPEGTAVVPPTPPVAPTPPAGAYAPPPDAVQPPTAVTPPQPPEAVQPPEQATPPESQESAPQAVPEGPMPKAM